MTKGFGCPEGNANAWPSPAPCIATGESGLIGHDENTRDILRACEFERVAGGKPFDVDQEWFDVLLTEIGQEKGPKANVSH